MDSSCTSSLFTDQDEVEPSSVSSFNPDSLCKSEDPLGEPIVQISLRKIQISSSQLINMSVKELNKRLAVCPAFVAAKLKRCRRTLKNRGYAKNCRIKRIAAKNKLEQTNSKLLSENRELRVRNKSLLDQLMNMSVARTNPGSSVDGSHLTYSGGVSFNPEENYRAIQDSATLSYQFSGCESSLQPEGHVYPFINNDSYVPTSNQTAAIPQRNQEFELGVEPSVYTGEWHPTS